MNCQLNIPENIHLVFKNKIKEISNALVKNAADLEMKELWLFGSVARGDYTATSDIDLLVLTSSEQERKISLKVEFLELRNDIEYPNVDIIVRNRISLQKEKDYIFNKLVKKDKIILWSDANG